MNLGVFPTCNVRSEECISRSSGWSLQVFVGLFSLPYLRPQWGLVGCWKLILWIHQKAIKKELALLAMDCVFWSLYHSILVHCCVVTWIGVNFHKRELQLESCKVWSRRNVFLFTLGRAPVGCSKGVVASGVARRKKHLKFPLCDKWYQIKGSTALLLW